MKPGAATSPAVLAQLSRSAASRKAVSGNLLVTTELDGRSVTVPAILLAEFPDRARLELQDPVGGLIALLVLNGERFWLFERDRADVLTGPLAKLPSGLLPPLSGADLVRAFLARPGEAELRAAKPSGERIPVGDAVYWEGDPAEVAAWRRGAAVATYEDYEFKSGLRFPSRVRLSGPAGDGRRRELLLVWKDWDPSVPQEKKLFQIPQQETFGRKIKELR